MGTQSSAHCCFPFPESLSAEILLGKKEMDFVSHTNHIPCLELGVEKDAVSMVRLTQKRAARMTPPTGAGGGGIRTFDLYLQCIS